MPRSQTKKRHPSKKQPKAVVTSTAHQEVDIWSWFPRFLSLFVLAIWGVNTVISRSFALIFFFDIMLWLMLLCVTLVSWQWARLGGVLWVMLGFSFILANQTIELDRTLIMGVSSLALGLLFLASRSRQAPHVFRDHLISSPR